jgi:electron transport complex protein RnfB
MADSAQVERIDALLPQTQCGQCGYDACRPYARALADGEADINRCPPGGDAGIQALARELDVPAKPLDESRGVHHDPPRVAVIDEPACIGCTRCIQACPVDAIVGAAKRMHTVIADECTGCELCLPPCPVDCIDTVSVPARTRETAQQKRNRVQHARRRFQARSERLQARRQEKTQARVSRGQQDEPEDGEQAVIATALARARGRHRPAQSAPPANAVNKAIERARAQRRQGDGREQG